jgi:predicted nucleic acid-binding protein
MNHAVVVDASVALKWVLFEEFNDQARGLYEAALHAHRPHERAFLFARDNRLPSLYDSLYVVLAQMMEVTLWTADQRLFTTAALVAPWVHWIGDYPQP